ncbi:AsmA family protein [Marinobacter sp. CHS3-4]|uniref:AsmA family protein n=1 Tax=Marinobacter sp. CHS3-4 TaxID=3045174 RepID=UPI0024B62E1B|nr:AsmA family protein [Marinobacter sp. CHS3-4]MDI9244446.1 AsmA family protein [Marinobacter sp. CHS3-4]
MKAVRYIALTIIGLIVLAIAAVAVAVAVIDPNTYKPQIEDAVESSTNLDLILGGDIGWSFIPLGLELNDVEATLDNERLVRLDQLVAEVDFWSLIAMSPRVNTFLLNGLDANLSVNEQGEGNWTRIMPEGQQTADTAPEPAAASEEEAPAEASSGGTPLNFNVDQIEISNARVHYDDKSTGQSVTLEGVTLTAREITLGSSFPLELSFRFATNQPQFELEGSISAKLTANEALNDFTVADLDASFDMAGEPLGGESVSASLSGSLAANLESETATLSDFTATLADLTLNTDLNVVGFGAKPQLTGNLSIAEFSPKSLLSSLGQPAIETTDSDVLSAVAFSTSIGGSPGTIALSDLTLSLDDTTFSGGASYALANSGIQLNLKGDAINVDRYLPPASEESASESAPAEPASTAESDLLPLETLRSLALDIKLGLGELIVSNLTIQDINSVITAKNGLLKVEDFSGKLYEGGFNAQVTLDARSDNPSWVIGSKVDSVETLPLLTDLAEVQMLSGAANLNLDVKTTGNRISALRNNAKGDIGFKLAEGEFTKINLTRMACQGIALVNQDQLGTDDWGTSTPFNDMSGTLKINGNTINNTDLIAALAGMQLEGKGTVDLAASEMDYEAGLRIVGEIHRDEACRVTDTVRNVIIPVECRGNFAEDPAGLCSFDGSRFQDTLKTIAKNAVKQKATEEVDRAKEKAKEKAEEKLKEELGDKLKGLFN